MKKIGEGKKRPKNLVKGVKTAISMQVTENAAKIKARIYLTHQVRYNRGDRAAKAAGVRLRGVIRKQRETGVVRLTLGVVCPAKAVYDESLPLGSFWRLERTNNGLPRWF